MRLLSNTLSKLAVSANLICLLMVVTCGALPSMVRSVRLYSECSTGYLKVDMKGRVQADEAVSESDQLYSERFQNLTFISKDFGLQLTIFAEEAKRYVCFNSKWKLIGSKRFRGPMCLFREGMAEGYNQYRSVADPSRMISFNSRGRPIKGPQNKLYRKCTNFLKYDNSFNIDHHYHERLRHRHSRRRNFIRT